jgi:hypothetical protein
MLEIAASSSHLYQSSRIVAVPTDEVASAALSRDSTARRILAKNHTLQDGQMVGSRLNLNVLKSTGVFVNTIHAPTNASGYKENRGWWNGEVLSYRTVVQLRNAYFNVQQAARERIASGRSNKSPMASVDGALDLATPNRFDGVELRFNPARERLFLDADGNPVCFAEHVTIIGHQVFARGLIRYFESEGEAPAQVGEAPCRAVYPGASLNSVVR